MYRFAKIVATLGPSSSDEAVLVEMVKAGMDVCRLNFSHGSHEDHGEKIKLIRKISKDLGKPLSILMDLQGPKLRIGVLPDGGIKLRSGQEVALSSREDPQNLPEGVVFIPFDVPKLHEALVPGNHILLDDGQLEFEVLRLDGENIFAKVILGGNLKSHKGVNLPGSNLDIPVLTPKDLEDMEFGLEAGVDLVAISFVKRASDIEMARDTMRTMIGNRRLPPIIAKLERPEAITNLEEIIKVTDGVMVARGDLGVEMPPEDVPRDLVTMNSTVSLVDPIACEQWEVTVVYPEDHEPEKNHWSILSPVGSALFGLRIYEPADVKRGDRLTEGWVVADIPFQPEMRGWMSL